MPTKVERLAAGPSASAATGSFREFVRFIHDAFNGSGFVNTFPSGAINTASVDPPTAINQPRGYNVWAFGDALQSTSPYFIRIGFRSVNSTNFNAWGLDIWFGTNHDGSGNLSDALSTGSVTVIGHNSSGGSFTAQQSASFLWTGESGSRVAVVAGAYASGFGADFTVFWFNIARMNDWNGNLIGSGVIMHYGGTSGSSPRAGHTIQSSDIGGSYRQTAGHTLLLSNTVNTGSGGTPAISPLFTGKGVLNANSYDVYAVNNIEPPYSASNGNITGSQYTINTYGVNRNYIRMPAAIGGSSTNLAYSTNGLFALLLRYE